MAELHNSGPINFNEEPTFGLQIPLLAADPAVPQQGDIWVNTTSHALKISVNGVVKTVTLT